MCGFVTIIIYLFYLFGSGLLRRFEGALLSLTWGQFSSMIFRPSYLSITEWWFLLWLLMFSELLTSYIVKSCIEFDIIFRINGWLKNWGYRSDFIMLGLFWFWSFGGAVVFDFDLGFAQYILGELLVSAEMVCYIGKCCCLVCV